MPSSLGPAEIMVILVVALIVLGPTRLPEAGRQVGRALAEVRRWAQGMQNEIRDAIETEPPRTSAPPAPSAVTAGPLTAVPSEAPTPALPAVEGGTTSDQPPVNDAGSAAPADERAAGERS